MIECCFQSYLYPFITLDNIKKRVDAWTDHTYIDNVIIVLNININMAMYIFCKPGGGEAIV